MKRCTNNMNEHVYNMEWCVYYSKWYIYSVECFDKISIQNGNVHAIPLNKMVNDRKDFKVIVERNLQSGCDIVTRFYRPRSLIDGISLDPHTIERIWL